MTATEANYATNSNGHRSEKRTGLWKRVLPVVALIGVVTLILGLDLDQFLTFEALRAHRIALLEFVHTRVLIAALLFMAVYATSTALSLPGGAILSITGGFLFSGMVGGLYVIVGATVGATAIFLAAKTVLGDSLRHRAGPWLTKMQAGFRDNALSYLLVLRLIPLFPFWLVNLVPAFLGVRLGTYVLGTAIGIVPGTLVFTFTGAGIGSVLDSGETFSPGAVLTPEILAALSGLALLSLLPVGYKHYKRKQAVDADEQRNY